jgi:hypothetical protein
MYATVDLKNMRKGWERKKEKEERNNGMKKCAEE